MIIDHIEGILPKGCYLPCVSMAVGPFWQDTIDISLYAYPAYFALEQTLIRRLVPPITSDSVFKEHVVKGCDDTTIYKRFPCYRPFVRDIYRQPINMESNVFFVANLITLLMTYEISHCVETQRNISRDMTHLQVELTASGLLYSIVSTLIRNIHLRPHEESPRQIKVLCILLTIR